MQCWTPTGGGGGGGNGGGGGGGDLGGGGGGDEGGGGGLKHAGLKTRDAPVVLRAENESPQRRLNVRYASMVRPAWAAWWMSLSAWGCGHMDIWR